MRNKFGTKGPSVIYAASCFPRTHFWGTNIQQSSALTFPKVVGETQLTTWKEKLWEKKFYNFHHLLSPSRNDNAERAAELSLGKLSAKKFLRLRANAGSDMGFSGSSINLSRTTEANLCILWWNNKSRTRQSIVMLLWR